LPPYAIFDYKKYEIIKKLILFFIFNALFITTFTTVIFFEVKNYKKIERSYQNFYIKLKNLNESFTTFKNEYKNLTEKLKLLNLKEKKFYLNYPINYSTLIGTLIIFDTLSENVSFKSIDFDIKSGEFLIIGEAKNSKDFNNYYKQLEVNNYFSSVEFFYLKKIKNTLEFKIKVKIKSLDETI